MSIDEIAHPKLGDPVAGETDADELQGTESPSAAAAPAEPPPAPSAQPQAPALRDVEEATLSCLQLHPPHLEQQFWQHACSGAWLLRLDALAAAVEAGLAVNSLASGQLLACERAALTVLVALLLAVVAAVHQARDAYAARRQELQIAVAALRTACFCLLAPPLTTAAASSGTSAPLAAAHVLFVGSGVHWLALTGVLQRLPLHIKAPLQLLILAAAATRRAAAVAATLSTQPYIAAATQLTAAVSGAVSLLLAANMPTHLLSELFRTFGKHNSTASGSSTAVSNSTTPGNSTAHSSGVHEGPAAAQGSSLLPLVLFVQVLCGAVLPLYALAVWEARAKLWFMATVALSSSNGSGGSRIVWRAPPWAALMPGVRAVQASAAPVQRQQSAATQASQQRQQRQQQQQQQQQREQREHRHTGVGRGTGLAGRSYANASQLLQVGIIYSVWLCFVTALLWTLLLLLVSGD